MALTPPRLFFDTSVLIQSVIDYGPETRASRAIVQRALTDGDVSGITARHCLLEWYSVATRFPEPYRVSPAVARRVLAESFLPRLEIVGGDAITLGPFFDTAAADNVSGGRVYDAWIAESARQACAGTVITENRRHFVSLLRYGIRVVTAAEYLAELQAPST